MTKRVLTSIAVLTLTIVAVGYLVFFTHVGSGIVELIDNLGRGDPPVPKINKNVMPPDSTIAVNSTPLIGKVEPTGYGCNFSDGEGEGFIFVASFATDPGFWMNIDGKRVFLEQENTDAYFPNQKGEKSSLKFTAEKLRVILEVQNVTDPKKEIVDSAEYDYEGTLRVISTNTDRTIKVSGTCGS